MSTTPKYIEPEGQLLTEAQGLLTSLWTDKPTAQALLNIYVQPLQQLYDLLAKIILWMDVDNAEGDILYKLAERVGAPIVYTDQIQSQFIGWDDQEDGLPMADTQQKDLLAGRWREDNEADITAESQWEAERMVVKAKILKNQSHGYTPEVQQALSILFDGCFTYVHNNMDMSFGIDIGRILTPIEIQLIRTYDILPRPAGVQIDKVVYWDSTLPVFAFEHQRSIPGAAGFGVGYMALGI